MTERTAAAQVAARTGTVPSGVQRLVIGVCAALMVYVALVYVITLTSIPRYYQRVTSGEVPAVILGGESDVSNAIVAEAAARRSQSLAVYAVYHLVLRGVVAAGFWAAAALVLRGRGGDWFRWLTALLLFFYPSGELYTVTIIANGVPTFEGAGGLLWPLWLVLLFLFPNGRAAARWTRWPMAGFVVAHAAFQTLAFVASMQGWQLPVALLPVYSGVILTAFVFLAACQIYRYVRVAGPVERKQIQWFVAGLTFLAVVAPLSTALAAALGAQGEGYMEDLDSLSGLILPAAITIGILRYRLWDIDVIIRRTLIYSVLSAVLALAYLGSVLVLESVFRALTGQGQNSLVVVLSTLAIAALFGPLRGRVQRAIDRRFYRQKYDAARTLAGFAAGARDETDLERLSAHLVQVVDETMQPESVGLWLVPAPRAAHGPSGATVPSEASTR